MWLPQVIELLLPWLCNLNFCLLFSQVLEKELCFLLMLKVIHQGIWCSFLDLLIRKNEILFVFTLDMTLKLFSIMQNLVDEKRFLLLHDGFQWLSKVKTPSVLCIILVIEGLLCLDHLGQKGKRRHQLLVGLVLHLADFLQNLSPGLILFGMVVFNMGIQETLG